MTIRSGLQKSTPSNIKREAMRKAAHDERRFTQQYNQYAETTGFPHNDQIFNWGAASAGSWLFSRLFVRSDAEFSSIVAPMESTGAFNGFTMMAGVYRLARENGVVVGRLVDGSSVNEAVDMSPIIAASNIQLRVNTKSPFELRNSASYAVGVYIYTGANLYAKGIAGYGDNPDDAKYETMAYGSWVRGLATPSDGVPESVRIQPIEPFCNNISVAVVPRAYNSLF